MQWDIVFIIIFPFSERHTILQSQLLTKTKQVTWEYVVNNQLDQKKNLFMIKGRIGLEQMIELKIFTFFSAEEKQQKIT